MYYCIWPLDGVGDRFNSHVNLMAQMDLIKKKNRSKPVKNKATLRHTPFASKYPAGDSRKKACQRATQQSASRSAATPCTQGDGNSVGFAGSLALLRNRKPFTDGEFATHLECWNIVWLSWKYILKNVTFFFLALSAKKVPDPWLSGWCRVQNSLHHFLHVWFLSICKITSTQ